MLPYSLMRSLTALSFAVAVAAKGGQRHVKRTSDASASSGELHDFQVYPPVLTAAADARGKNEYGCVVTKTLMDYDFANSYGEPYVGEFTKMFATFKIQKKADSTGFYTPPDCDFNRVVIEFNLTSRGR